MDNAHAHSHAHPHAHHHHHHQEVDWKNINNAFVIGMVLNLAFVVVEVIVGLVIHSLSLLSDAGHNLADVASLALSLLAFRLMKIKSNKKYTYGYKKTSILVALFNAAVLLLSIGAICYEAMHRLLDPEPLPGKTIALVAGIGILINGLTAMLFYRTKDSDLNIRSAFLHLLADALVSAALVVGGLLIFWTGKYWIDAALSILVAAVILFSTWHLLTSSLRLSLDGVPAGIDLDTVRSTIRKMSGVKDFHHIHIWAISTTENALTAHLVVDTQMEFSEIEILKRGIKHELLHLNIQHATLETELDDAHCGKPDCD